MDDIATQFGPMHQSGRVLHVATHAKFVFDWDNCVSFFGGEEARVTKQEIRIKALRKLFTVDLTLFQTFSQS